MSSRDRIIVALDCPKPLALDLAAGLRGRATWLKVGMTLYYAAGPQIVSTLKTMGYRVFVDLKLHDIPHQVREAAANLAALGADLLTVHAAGGRLMMQAALEGVEAGWARAVAAEASSTDDVAADGFATDDTAAEASSTGDVAAPPAARPRVLAVTVLTSMDDVDLWDIGVRRLMPQQVLALAELSHAAGLDGVVCSPHEAAKLREALGPKALVVTPGIRPQSAAKDDQSRVASPRAALAAGASHLVIGRPISAAPDPVSAFETIVRSIDEQTDL
jgi:orotidine-5'-phosphate decarboxylase